MSAQLSTNIYFPTWFKNQNIFDRALLTSTWLENKDKKKVTAAFVITTELTGLPERQRGLVPAIQHLYAEKMISELFNQQKGRGLEVQSGNHTYTLGIDSEFIENRQSALTFVEENLLCSPSKITTPKEMEQFICKLHSLFAKDLVNSSGIPIPPGNYRDSIILLPKDNVGQNMTKVAENVQKKDRNAVVPFLTLVKRIEKSKDPCATLKQFTEEEARVFSLGFDTLYMDWKEIPAAMTKFCEEYLRKIQAETDPLDLATWVHMELINIHPFIDLNGHISRTLASAELRRGNLSPIFIFDENAYVKAQERRDSAEFKAFLKRTINLSAKLEKILETEETLQSVLVRC